MVSVPLRHKNIYSDSSDESSNIEAFVIMAEGLLHALYIFNAINDLIMYGNQNEVKKKIICSSNEDIRLTNMLKFLCGTQMFILFL